MVAVAVTVAEPAAMPSMVTLVPALETMLMKEPPELMLQV